MGLLLDGPSCERLSLRDRNDSKSGLVSVCSIFAGKICSIFQDMQDLSRFENFCSAPNLNFAELILPYVKNSKFGEMSALFLIKISSKISEKI